MRKLAILILLLSTQSFAGSFYNVEFNLSSANTDNLFNDSANAKDMYSSIRSTANIYPIKNSELNVFAEYTNYGNNPNLSNISYGTGLTILPLSDSSNFSILLTGSFQKYSYKDALTTNSTEFVEQNISTLAGIGYQISEIMNVRSGFSYKQTGYANEDVSDVKVNEIFGGFNYTFLDENAVDFEFGYSFEKYQYLPEFINFMGTGTYLTYGFNDTLAYDTLKTGDLKSIYYSGRLSRPLGKKTGIMITYSSKQFKDKIDSSVIYGYSTGLLSPWASNYEGNSLQIKVKTYLINNFIITSGFGYWNKDYLRMNERGIDPFTGDPVGIISTKYSYDRTDIMRKFVMTLQFPIVLPSGSFIEPVLNVEFTNNNSTVDVYNYDDFTVSTGLTFRL